MRRVRLLEAAVQEAIEAAAWYEAACPGLGSEFDSAVGAALDLLDEGLLPRSRCRPCRRAWHQAVRDAALSLRHRRCGLGSRVRGARLRTPRAPPRVLETALSPQRARHNCVRYREAESPSRVTHVGRSRTFRRDVVDARLGVARRGRRGRLSGQVARASHSVEHVRVCRPHGAARAC